MCSCHTGFNPNVITNLLYVLIFDVFYRLVLYMCTLYATQCNAIQLYVRPQFKLMQMFSTHMTNDTTETYTSQMSTAQMSAVLMNSYQMYAAQMNAGETIAAQMFVALMNAAQISNAQMCAAQMNSAQTNDA